MTLSLVMISWPATSATCSRRSTAFQRDLARALPEHVQALAEPVDQHAVAVEQDVLVRVDLHAVEPLRGVRVLQDRLRAAGARSGTCVDVERLDVQPVRRLPERVPARAERS